MASSLTGTIGRTAPGWSYSVKGVKFDGYDRATGEVIDAKWGYQQFIDKLGEWRDSFLHSSSGGVDKMAEQARKQVQAAGEGNVIWRVSNRQAADLVRDTLRSQDVTGIEVVFWPQP